MKYPMDFVLILQNELLSLGFPYQIQIHLDEINSIQILQIDNKAIYNIKKLLLSQDLFKEI